MHRRFIQWSRMLLGFSRLETHGYAAIILFLLIMTARLHLVKVWPGTPFKEFHETQHLMDSLFTQLWEPIFEKTGPRGVLDWFNPNTISYDSLIVWGIPREVAANLIKYRRAGGTLRYKANMRKIYGMNDSLWATLRPYLELPDRPGKPPLRNRKSLRKEENAINLVNPAPFDINLADTAQLKQISGIGSVLGARIIKYRSLLGGYYSKDQFQEIYGLSTEVLQRLGKNVVINSDFTYHKILLNSFDYKQLIRHPYITHAQAKAIIAYRDLHGPFEDLTSLKNLHLIDDSTYFKVYPYLDF